MFFSDTVKIHHDFLVTARWNHIDYLSISELDMAYFISYLIASGADAVFPIGNALPNPGLALGFAVAVAGRVYGLFFPYAFN